MNELTLADLDMGTCLPQVLSTSTPTLDSRGTFTLEMFACCCCTDATLACPYLKLSRQ